MISPAHLLLLTLYLGAISLFLIMISISYYFLLKKKYSTAALCIGLGAFAFLAIFSFTTAWTLLFYVLTSLVFGTIFYHFLFPNLKNKDLYKIGLIVSLFILITIPGFFLGTYRYQSIKTSYSLQENLGKVSSSIDSLLSDSRKALTDVSDQQLDPKSLEQTLKPSLLLTTNSNGQITYATPNTPLKGQLSLWFPWVSNMEPGELRQGITSYSDTLPIAATVTMSSSKTITLVGYYLTQDYVQTFIPAKLPGLGLGNYRSLVWSTSSSNSIGAILSSSDTSQLAQSNIGNGYSSYGLHSGSLNYNVGQLSLPSLDSEKPYYLLGIVPTPVNYFGNVQ